MKTGTVLHHPRQGPARLLADRVGLADSFLGRLRGLMGRAPLAAGEGLWIQPCQQVHTQFMRGPIDVLFLDAEGQVLTLIPAMKPWRFSPFLRGSRSVLELAPGAAAGVAVGDRLSFRAGAA